MRIEKEKLIETIRRCSWRRYASAELYRHIKPFNDPRRCSIIPRLVTPSRALDHLSRYTQIVMHNIESLVQRKCRLLVDQIEDRNE
jgi:hypothetical protein